MPQHVQISVNDKPRRVHADTTLAALLEELRLDARSVAVEVNLDLVPRERHADVTLAEGDRLEIVTLVGGG